MEEIRSTGGEVGFYELFAAFLLYLRLYFRYHPKQLPEFPECGHNSKSYQCSILTMSEIKKFHQAFYRKPTKLVQDTFILKFCSIGEKKRIRNPNSKKNRTVAISYFVQRENKRVVPVCKSAFLKILNITKHRVEGVMKRFYEKSEMPTEHRGGDHTSQKNADRRQAVIEFVKRIAIMEKHYCRGKSVREYVSSDLNIAKLWKMYCKDNIEFPVKECFFRNVFNTNFNIGFNAPAVDVCSTCLEFKEKLKHSEDEEQKIQLHTESRIHKLRAKAFFDMLKEERENLLTISFDCQKNLVLPKIPDQITYYKRQLYLYNFSVVRGSSKSSLTRNNVFIHTWYEQENPKSSNQIVSAVYDCLNKFELDNSITEVRLMADGCAGQNKNSCMIAMGSKWLSQAPKHIQKVEFVFPVTGHSFLPPDRVFANIEKKLRKKDTIIDPEIYLNLFAEAGTVKRMGKDWEVLNWRDAAKDVLKSTNALHFQITACKRFVITKTKKGNILVRGEPNYKNDVGTGQSICKRGKTILMLSPKRLSLGIPVQKVKIDNINELLSKHFGKDWLQNAEKYSLQFYKNIILSSNGDVEEDEQESDLCQHKNIDSENQIV